MEDVCYYQWPLPGMNSLDSSESVMGMVVRGEQKFASKLVATGQVASTRMVVLWFFLHQIRLRSPAGAIGSSVGSPTDVPLIRMQADATLPLEQIRHYKNVVHALYRIVADEGVLSLWKGAWPTVVRAMTLNMGMLASYDQSVEFCKDTFGLGKASTRVVSPPEVEEEDIVSLPHDIIFQEILIRVSAKTLPRFKCVCKHWNTSISNTWFVNAHVLRSRSLPPDDGIIHTRHLRFTNYITEETFDTKLDDIISGFVGLVTSTDGLVVVRAYDEDPVTLKYNHCFYIVNPVTCYQIRLPPPPSHNWEYCRLLFENREYCRLVFDDTTRQYKLVVWDVNDKCDYGSISVLTLTTGCRNEPFWKPLSLPKSCEKALEYPEVLNGKIYWVSSIRSEKRYIVLSMDIASEEIEEIKMPNHCKLCLGKDWMLKVVEVEGSLYLVYNASDMHCYIIWVLEDWKKHKWAKLHQKKYVMHDSCDCSGSDYIKISGWVFDGLEDKVLCSRVIAVRMCEERMGSDIHYCLLNDSVFYPK
ncbi:hypothetical protein IFM89_028982 [Coptis chinensis]|uniref:F-box domain-containing protein n=1 Tax=Coptis chinensis TaxID=261450 RepID=A0A835IEL3_9MAGN|nr:hypothetical protein IFM89_028982 [Coptis chinensis]